MSDLPPTNNREIPTPTTSKPSTHGWFWAVFVFLILVIILAAIAGYLLFQSKPGNGSGTLSAADIRKLFSPNPTPTPTNASASATPTPTVSVTPTPTASPSATVSPTPSVTPSATPTTTPTPSPTEYVNQTLGFSMDLPNNWQATAGGDGQTIAFTSATGQNGTVQSYAQTNESLDTIRQQLAGSQSVSNIVQTTYLGESALSFKIPGQGKQGITLIHNNRIYYIIAPSLIDPPFSSFSFM